MKKNISINISGIIFHIEEDGYEQLKEYLGSINKYFSSFDDSSEIVADIESRIAEIFLAKLNETKQVITADDVSSLIATMGSIQDFQAVEDEPVQPQEEARSGNYQQGSTTSGGTQRKRLYRDNNRRIIGGVAAGIANYFSVDPVWIRLIFVLLLFDVFLTFSLSAVVIVGYIIMWIVVPGSYTLEEDKSMKKIYRNPDGSVIAGVANGIAKYFNIDVTVVRVLFVVTTFAGGLGVFAYIVLWIILPEARTITDKVQMEGEAVTLENIEQNIKKSEVQRMQPNDESALVKILLFPFRLIAKILRGIAYALGPIMKFMLEALRVVAGLFLVLLGLAFIFSTVVLGAVLLGITTAEGLLHFEDFPVQMIYDTIPPLGVIASMLVVGIPALAFIMIGLSVLSKSRVGSPTLGWSMFAIWLFGLIGVSFMLPKVVFQFKDEGTVTTIQYFEPGEEDLILELNKNGYDEFREPRLRLRGYDGEQLKLVQDFSSRGRTEKIAEEEAQKIRYSVAQDESTIVFDRNFNFADDAQFRGQELSMTLYIPYGKEFSVNNDLEDILYYSFSHQGYRYSQIADNTWVFNPSGLDCTTCNEQPDFDSERRESFERQYEENMDVRGFFKEYEYREFDKLYVEGPFNLNIVQGDEFRLIVAGTEEYVKNTVLAEDQGTLNISYSGDEYDAHRYNRRLEIKMICPNINEISLRGSTMARVRGFDEDNMDVVLKGATELILDADIEHINIDLSGASRLDLVGRGSEIDAELTTASYLDSYGFQAEYGKVRASGASKVKIYASERLEIDASLISEVQYRGGAEVIKNKSSSSGQAEQR